MRVWEVRNEDGSELGLFLGDYYTRESKRGGAWMNSLVDQSALLGTKPVVINTLNISKPPAGEPTLLTLDEVRTMFHEFGHALHGLFSDVTYPRFSGTSVPRDFVEYPSQVNEMWIMWPEVLANYARHHATGEPLPQDVVDKLNASRLWGEGLRHHRVPGRCPAGPGLACAGAGRRPGRRPGLRGQVTRRRRHRARR